MKTIVKCSELVVFIVFIVQLGNNVLVILGKLDNSGENMALF